VSRTNWADQQLVLSRFKNEDESVANGDKFIFGFRSSSANGSTILLNQFISIQLDAQEIESTVMID